MRKILATIEYFSKSFNLFKYWIFHIDHAHFILNIHSHSPKNDLIFDWIASFIFFCLNISIAPKSPHHFPIIFEFQFNNLVPIREKAHCQVHWALKLGIGFTWICVPKIRTILKMVMGKEWWKKNAKSAKNGTKLIK